MQRTKSRVLLKHSVAAGCYWGWLHFHVLYLGPLWKQHDSFSELQPENSLTSWSKYKLRHQLSLANTKEARWTWEKSRCNCEHGEVDHEQCVMHKYERLCGWFIFCTWTFSWPFLFHAAYVCLFSPLMSHRRGMFTCAAAVTETKTHMCTMVEF